MKSAIFMFLDLYVFHVINIASLERTIFSTWLSHVLFMIPVGSKSAVTLLWI